LIIEGVRPNDAVFKLMPALIIENDLLEEGCMIIKRVVKELYKLH